jgi:hypothetical protein
VAPPPPPGAVYYLDVSPDHQAAFLGDIVTWIVDVASNRFPECTSISLSVTNLTIIDPAQVPCNNTSSDVDTEVPSAPGTYNCWWKARWPDGTIALKLTTVEVSDMP